MRAKTEVHRITEEYLTDPLGKREVREKKAPAPVQVEFPNAAKFRRWRG
jgi:hypothetical protein